MTAIIINRQAMKALIDADPDFELQLKNHVIAEVGRRFFEKDARRVIAAADPELFAHALAALQNDTDLTLLVQQALKQALTFRDGNWLSRTKLHPDVQKLLDEAVAEAKRKSVYDASVLVGQAIKAEVDKRLSDPSITELIEKRVNRLVTEDIEKRAEEMFQQRMASLRAAMAV
ncbi:hypothetical protein [Mesorhizobium sp. M0843]|uniref:hypothetical protein n=1 Tax=Mesorhizobium sp. M0843 TaxID=2957010 RepID=UPI003339FCF7